MQLAVPLRTNNGPTCMHLGVGMCPQLLLTDSGAWKATHMVSRFASKEVQTISCKATALIHLYIYGKPELVPQCQSLSGTHPSPDARCGDVLSLEEYR